TIEVAQQGTAEIVIYWEVFDADGNELNFVPDRGWWYGSGTAITIRNDGQPIDGSTVALSYRAIYYEQRTGNPRQRIIWEDGPSWVVRTEGPAQLHHRLTHTFDPETTLLTLEAGGSGQPPPSIEWQVSRDGGFRWESLGA